MFELIPFSALGPLHFGMTASEARAVLGVEPKELVKTRPRDAEASVHLYPENGLVVHFDERDAIEGIECWRGAEIEFDGIDLLRTAYPELESRLRGRDPSICIDRFGCVARRLGIAVYAPPGSPMGEYPEAIFVHRKGVYERYGISPEHFPPANAEEAERIAETRRDLLEALLLVAPAAEAADSGTYQTMLAAAIEDDDILNPYVVPRRIPYLPLHPNPLEFSREAYLTQPATLISFEEYQLLPLVGRSPIAELERSASSSSRADLAASEHPDSESEIPLLAEPLFELEPIDELPPLDTLEAHDEPKELVEVDEPSRDEAPPLARSEEEQERENLLEHVERYLGPPTLFHRSENHGVPLEIYHAAPTPERPLSTFVTFGMSRRPMNAPPEAEAYRHAELTVTVPKGWPLDRESLGSGRFSWPLDQLIFLARYPHFTGSWLWLGHTVPYDDPPKPYAPDTKLCCMLLLPPVVPPPPFRSVLLGTKETHLFALVPLYAEEMALKLREGSRALLPQFNRHGVNEIIIPDRANTATIG